MQIRTLAASLIMAASVTEDPEMAKKKNKKAARETKFGFYIQRVSLEDMLGSVFLFRDDFFFFLSFIFFKPWLKPMWGHRLYTALQPPV